MLSSLDIKKTKNKLKICEQVYADSAYANKQNDKKLGKQNNKILHRAYRNTPLTDKQKQDNKQRSSIRYIVERTFGLLKLHHGLTSQPLKTQTKNHPISLKTVKFYLILSFYMAQQKSNTLL
ncbi:MAG: transposase family protein [Methylococcales symbiont of Hymedesmia sp. n. MRB-2018]|nr:MAG: transposase family protein [Methylococcales symbiont of Hymedesmia sp. n. MRB-2018]